MRKPCLCLHADRARDAQVHVRYAGKGSMLLNTGALPGTAKRALKLAEREYQLSNDKPSTSEQVTKS